MSEMQFTWSDGKGQSQTLSFHAVDLAHARQLLDALHVQSLAGGFSLSATSFDATYNGWPPAGGANMSTGAVLTYADAMGNTARLWLPCPVPGTYEADGVTVSPSSIAAVTSAAIANLQTLPGTTVSKYISGYRRDIPLPPYNRQ